MLCNLIGLSLLLGPSTNLAILTQTLPAQQWHDPVLSLLHQLAHTSSPVAHQTWSFTPGFEHRLALHHAIISKCPDEAVDHLCVYLEQWYPSLTQLGWRYANSHHSLDVSLFPFYGYWSMETAAVVFKKSLNDTRLREHPYYPKDIVDYARSQRST